MQEHTRSTLQPFNDPNNHQTYRSSDLIQSYKDKIESLESRVNELVDEARCTGRRDEEQRSRLITAFKLDFDPTEASMQEVIDAVLVSMANGDSACSKVMEETFTRLLKGLDGDNPYIKGKR